MKLKLLSAVAIAVLTVFVSAAPAAAGTVAGKDYVWIRWPNSQNIQCWAILNVRSSDGYVQGKFQSNWYADNNTQPCRGWLERKRDGEGGYGWTPVSNDYDVYGDYKSTGWHWNGAKAASRVCIYNLNTHEGTCSTGVW